MTADLTCVHAGAVVGARHHLPTEAWGRWTGGGPAVGCNRLRCERCGENVRQETGFELMSPPPEPERVFTAPDWRQVAGLRATDGRERLYACRCRLHVEAAQHLLDAVPREFTDLDLPWRCAGHPAPPWPLSVDGMPLDDDTDVAGLIRQVLDGSRPMPSWADSTRHRSYWLERLTSLVPKLEPIVREQVCAALSHGTPEAVVRALHWLRGHPDAWPSIPLDLARSWRGVPHPWSSAFDLAWVAGQALAARLDAAESPADRARVGEQAATWMAHGIGVKSLGPAVARWDLGAFIRVLPDAARHRPDRLPDLLRTAARERPESVALLLRRLEGLQGVDWGAVRRVVQRLSRGKEQALAALDRAEQSAR